jgi:hypothetical protein
MAITQAIANTFKKQLFEADMNFLASQDKFKIALYTSSATLNSATTSFTTTNEVANSGQYASGGGLLVNLGTSLTAGVARVDFSDRSFTGVTLTARGALLYNTSSATTFYNSIPSSYINSSDFKNLWLTRR